MDQAEIGKKTILFYVKEFCANIEAVYGSVFLKRWPSVAEISAIPKIYN